MAVVNTVEDLAAPVMEPSPWHSEREARPDGYAEGARRGCEVCQRVLDTHWVGLVAGRAGSHCAGCCRSWTSPVEAHCATCHAHFSTPRAFDAHFARDGSHLDPATVRRRDGRPRFVARERPLGVTWAPAFYGTPPTGYGRSRDESD